MGEIRIGISGWTYAPWRGVFYPKKLPQHEELTYASRQLNTIEINGSFYALQRPASYRKWFEATPEDFLFAVKANRFITHTLRLRNIEHSLGNFFGSGVLALEDKLGPILWQLPPSFKYDRDTIEAFLKLLPSSQKKAAEYAEHYQDPWMARRCFLEVTKRRPLRHAIEVRHESFRTPEFYRLLKKHHVSLVISHSTDAWPYFEELTADFVYARLHGEGEVYSGGYGTRALNQWAKKIEQWASRKNDMDVYFYFDNDTKVRAPFDAMALAGRLDLKWSDHLNEINERQKKAA